MHLHFESQLVDRVLCRQFLHLHNPAELEAFVCHELRSHNSVEHLIEVDEALVYVDAHLENHSVDVFLLVIVIHAHVPLHLAGQLLDELRYKL